MVDSGWYQANFSASEDMGKNCCSWECNGAVLYSLFFIPAEWGKNMGCRFAMEKCLTIGVPSSFPDHYCTEPDVRGCLVGRYAKVL